MNDLWLRFHDARAARASDAPTTRSRSAGRSGSRSDREERVDTEDAAGGGFERRGRRDRARCAGGSACRPSATTRSPTRSAPGSVSTTACGGPDRVEQPVVTLWWDPAGGRRDLGGGGGEHHACPTAPERALPAVGAISTSNAGRRAVVSPASRAAGSGSSPRTRCSSWDPAGLRPVSSRRNRSSPSRSTPDGPQVDPLGLHLRGRLVASQLALERRRSRRCRSARRPRRCRRRSRQLAAHRPPTNRSWYVRVSMRTSQEPPRRRSVGLAGRGRRASAARRGPRPPVGTGSCSPRRPRPRRRTPRTRGSTPRSSRPSHEATATATPKRHVPCAASHVVAEHELTDPIVVHQEDAPLRDAGQALHEPREARRIPRA